ncbi:hypothetical protein GOE03_28435 [Sinorhizobium medicae]|nr:hypothetical protein [Sinorhizobium medicae]
MDRMAVADPGEENILSRLMRNADPGIVQVARYKLGEGGDRRLVLVIVQIDRLRLGISGRLAGRDEGGHGLLGRMRSAKIGNDRRVLGDLLGADQKVSRVDGTGKRATFQIGGSAPLQPMCSLVLEYGAYRRRGAHFARHG